MLNVYKIQIGLCREQWVRWSMNTSVDNLDTIKLRMSFQNLFRVEEVKNQALTDPSPRGICFCLILFYICSILHPNTGSNLGHCKPPSLSWIAESPGSINESAPSSSRSSSWRDVVLTLIVKRGSTLQSGFVIRWISCFLQTFIRMIQ